MELIEAMGFDDYKNIDAWNASRLKLLANSYHAYSFAMEKKGEESQKREAAHFQFGHAVHALALEGIEPTGKMASSVNQAVEYLFRNATAADMLDNIKPELTILWDDDQWGKCKARFDGWNEKLGLIVDLKVMSGGSHDPRKFGYASVKFGYDIQAAWYTRAAKAAGLELNDFVFIVLEKDYYDSSVLIAPPGMIAAGESELAYAWANLNEGLEKAGRGESAGRFSGVNYVEHRDFGGDLI